MNMEQNPITLDGDISKIPFQETPPPTMSSTEFWLDLRNTAIAPRAALHYLYNDLYTDFDSFGWKSTLTEQGNRIIPNLVQRILISEEDLSQLSKGIPNFSSSSSSKSQDYYIDQFLLEHIQSLDLVYLDKSSNTLIPYIPSVTKEKNDSSIETLTSPIGKRIPISSDPSTIVDPISAMEYLSKQNQWVLIDHQSSSDESEDGSNERNKKVIDLIDFLAITSGSSGSGGSGGSNLVLGESNTNKNSEKEQDEIVGGGGLAITCRTTKELLLNGASLQQYQYRAGKGQYHSMSDGGIALMCSNSDGFEDDRMTQKVAVVLPFDMSIWKTAAFMFGQSKDDEEESE